MSSLSLAEFLMLPFFALHRKILRKKAETCRVAGVEAVLESCFTGRGRRLLPLLPVSSLKVFNGYTVTFCKRELSNPVAISSVTIDAKDLKV